MVGGEGEGQGQAQGTGSLCTSGSHLCAEGAVAQADAPRARLHEDLAPEHGARVRRRLHVHQEHARIIRLAHAQILRRDLRLRGHVVAVDAHLHAVLIRQREHGPRVAARLHLACHRM